MGLWGYNALGQLGLNNDTNQDVPQLLFSGRKVKRVWTSRGHYTSTFIQDTSNNIWAAGCKSALGQLGLGHTGHVKVWTRVPGLDIVKNSIHDIKGDGATDGNHMSTIVHATYQGRRQLFSTGYNGVGQLAVGDYTNRKTFTRAEWGPRGSG